MDIQIIIAILVSVFVSVSITLLISRYYFQKLIKQLSESGGAMPQAVASNKAALSEPTPPARVGQILKKPVLAAYSQLGRVTTAIRQNRLWQSALGASGWILSFRSWVSALTARIPVPPKVANGVAGFSKKPYFRAVVMAMTVVLLLGAIVPFSAFADASLWTLIGAGPDISYYTGNVQVSRNSFLGSSVTGGSIVPGSSGGAQIEFEQIENDDLLHFLTHESGQSHARRMTIDEIGNVGIGVVDPVERLEVEGGNVQVPRNSYLGSSASGGPIVLAASGGAQIEFEQIEDDDLLHFLTHESGQSHARRMTINEIGNVGIGDTNPGSYSGEKLLIDNTWANNRATVLNLLNNSATPGTGVSIDFTPNVNIPLARITADRTEVSAGGDTDLVFSTYNGGLSDKVWIKHNGNVGIGTSSPVTKLQVDTDSANTSYAAVQANDIPAYIRNSNATNNNFEILSFGDAGGWGIAQVGAINVDHTNHVGELFFSTKPDGGFLTQRMLIDQNGNVGIGTSAPAHQLEVEGNASASHVATRIENTDASGYSTLWMGGSNDGLLRGGSSSGWGSMLKLATSASTPIAIATNNTNRMMIGADGNVGIGTDTPDAKLDVDGRALVDLLTVDSDRVDSANRFFRVSSYGSDGVIRVNPGSGSTIYVNREVGVKKNFHIWDGDTAPVFSAIGASGNVGIGTSTPDPNAKLDVAGNIKLNGNITSDGDICIGVCD